MINDKKNKVINNKKNEYERYTVLTLILIFVKGQYVGKKKKKKKYRMKVPIQES